MLPFDQVWKLYTYIPVRMPFAIVYIRSIVCLFVCSIFTYFLFFIRFISSLVSFVEPKKNIGHFSIFKSSMLLRRYIWSVLAPFVFLCFYLECLYVLLRIYTWHLLYQIILYFWILSIYLSIYLFWNAIDAWKANKSKTRQEIPEWNSTLEKAALPFSANPHKNIVKHEIPFEIVLNSTFYTIFVEREDKMKRKWKCLPILCWNVSGCWWILYDKITQHTVENFSRLQDDGILFHKNSVPNGFRASKPQISLLFRLSPYANILQLDGDGSYKQ